jgi:hypothetical protein
MIDPAAIDAVDNAANRREVLQALVQRSALVHRCKSNAASHPDELSDTIAANANRYRRAVQN